MSEKKSHFSVTCSLLSQYLKEKRSFGDLSVLDMASRPQEPNKVLGSFQPPTTMNLLPGVDVSAETETDTTENAAKSMELFPKQTGFDLAEKKTDTKETKKAQLTIFYDGKVLVFDNFPADKAKDLMQLAAKGCSAASAAPSTTSALADRPPASCPSTSGSKPTPAQPNPPELPMPIARRASLHRFFAKRKDRISSKAPYQVHDTPSPVEDSGKAEESLPWLGLGPDRA